MGHHKRHKKDKKHSKHHRRHSSTPMTPQPTKIQQPVTIQPTITVQPPVIIDNNTKDLFLRKLPKQIISFSPPTTSTGTKRALLIGINYLQNPINKLNGCINDVHNIKALLMA